MNITIEHALSNVKSSVNFNNFFNEKLKYVEDNAVIKKEMNISPSYGWTSGYLDWIYKVYINDLPKETMSVYVDLMGKTGLQASPVLFSSSLSLFLFGAADPILKSCIKEADIFSLKKMDMFLNMGPLYISLGDKTKSIIISLDLYGEIAPEYSAVLTFINS